MTAIEFIVPGKVDTNHRPRATVVRGKPRMRKLASYSAYVQKVAWLARSKFGARWTCVARYSVEVTVHEHDRRSRDLDNACKGVLDGLTGIAWDDDRQIDRLIVSRGEVRRTAPCVVVKVEVIKEDER